MVIVRQKIAKHPKLVSKQLTLFKNDYEINRYRYICNITTLKVSAPHIWKLYRRCANCENIIKELKYDYD